MSLHLRNGLTRKQDDFAKGVAADLSARAAYRQAYNTENMSDNAVRIEGSRLAARPNIALRIEELMRQAAVYAGITPESVAERLDDAYETAKDAKVPQTATMVSAAVKLAHLGKVEIDPTVKVESKSLSINVAIDGMTKDELLALVARGDAAEAIEARAHEGESDDHVP